MVAACPFPAPDPAQGKAGNQPPAPPGSGALAGRGVIHQPEGIRHETDNPPSHRGRNPAGSGAVGSQVIVGGAVSCVQPRAIPGPHHGSNTVLIAGVVLAGAVLCAVALILVVSYRRRARQS
jgi:hypothetical protein